MKTLILSQNDIVPGSNNTILEYAFPSGGVHLKEKTRVALSSITMYASTPNISSSYNNNSFSYTWVNGQTYPVQIQDGNYEISDLNNLLHQTMKTNLHFLKDASGTYIWFLTMAVNTSNYKIDFVCYPMSTALYPTLTSPTTAWSIPVTATIPQVVIPSNNFKSIVGFAPATYPSVQGFSTIQIVSSTMIPQVSPLSSYLVKCNLVSNVYSVPNSLVYSFPPGGSFGKQFYISPTEYSYIDVSPGNYSVFRVELTDQSDLPVVILDPNIVILMVIKDADE